MGLGRRPASDWSRSMLSEPAVPLEDAFPWSAGSALWHGPAPVADLSAPAVTVLRDVTRGGTRELTLRISSRRDASTLGLWVDGRSATVRARRSAAGTSRPTDPGASGLWGSASMGRRWTASRYDWSWTSTPTASRSGLPTPLTISVWCLASCPRLRAECSSPPRSWRPGHSCFDRNSRLKGAAGLDLTARDQPAGRRGRGPPPEGLHGGPMKSTAPCAIAARLLACSARPRSIAWIGLPPAATRLIIFVPCRTVISLPSCMRYTVRASASALGGASE